MANPFVAKLLLCTVLLSTGVSALMGSLPHHSVVAAGLSRSRTISLTTMLDPLFGQRRFQVDERLPYVNDGARIRWISPDRLRTDVYGSNLHVGAVGCVLGNFWVCGPDKAPHGPEGHHAVLNALFPQNLISGYCCLHHLAVSRVAGGRSYSIRAVGDPWPYSPGCLGCGEALHPPSVRSEHYQATLTIDAIGRPLRLTSTVAIEPQRGRHGKSVLHEQDVSFTYTGTWTVDIPHNPRLPCPSWDRTPGSWCVRAR